MAQKRTEALKGGVDALFGGAPTRQDKVQAPEVEATVGKGSELIETVSDEELRAALRQRQMDGRGRPKKGRPHDKRTDGYGTICVKANLDKWAKLEYISLHESLQKKEVLELALDMLIDKYEAEKGEIILTAHDKTGNVFNK